MITAVDRASCSERCDARRNPEQPYLPPTELYQCKTITRKIRIKPNVEKLTRKCKWVINLIQAALEM